MPPPIHPPHNGAFSGGGLGGYGPAPIPNGDTAPAAPNGAYPSYHASAPREPEDVSQTTMQALEQLRRRSESSYEGRPACDNCRRRKTKCDRAQPVCGRCAKLGRKCTRSDVLMRRGPPSNKERAAYQAAGIEIPSLKYRHRTRRAQNSAGSQTHGHLPPNAAAPGMPPASHHGSQSFNAQGPASMGPPLFSSANPWPGTYPASANPGTNSFSGQQSNGLAAGLPGPTNRCGQGLHTSEQGPPVESAWYRGHRRGYTGMDAPLAARTTGSTPVPSPVASATPQDLSQRRWSLLPPIPASLDGQVEGETDSRFMPSYGADTRASFSSGASSLSPRARGGLFGSQPPAARLAPDSSYYLGGPYGPGGPETSPGSTASLPPPTMGHDAVATGLVASPLTDDACYRHYSHEPSMGYAGPAPLVPRSYQPCVMSNAPPASLGSSAPPAPAGPLHAPPHPPTHPQAGSPNPPGSGASYELPGSYSRPGSGPGPGMPGQNTYQPPAPYAGPLEPIAPIPAGQGQPAAGPGAGPAAASGGLVSLDHLPRFP